MPLNFFHIISMNNQNCCIMRTIVTMFLLFVPDLDPMIILLVFKNIISLSSSLINLIINSQKQFTNLSTSTSTSFTFEYVINDFYKNILRKK